MTIVALIVAVYLLAAAVVQYLEWSEQRAADDSYGRVP